MASRLQSRQIGPERQPDLPSALRKEIAVLARKLGGDYRSVFASDPTLRKRALLHHRLPGAAVQRLGRPGTTRVTEELGVVAAEVWLARRRHHDRGPAQPTGPVRFAGHAVAGQHAVQLVAADEDALTLVAH